MGASGRWRYRGLLDHAAVFGRRCLRRPQDRAPQECDPSGGRLPYGKGSGGGFSARSPFDSTLCRRHECDKLRGLGRSPRNSYA